MLRTKLSHTHTRLYTLPQPNPRNSMVRSELGYEAIGVVLLAALCHTLEPRYMAIHYRAVCGVNKVFILDISSPIPPLNGTMGHSHAYKGCWHAIKIWLPAVLMLVPNLLIFNICWNLHARHHPLKRTKTHLCAPHRVGVTKTERGRLRQPTNNTTICTSSVEGVAAENK